MAKRVSIRDRMKQQEEQDEHLQEQTGRGVKAYTGALKQDSQHQEPEATTRITLRIPISVAQLIDEVFGKKKLRGEVKHKYEFVGDILRPPLETERKRLLALEIEELEEKRRQFTNKSGE